MAKPKFKDEQEEKEFDFAFDTDTVEVARSCSRKVNLGNYETIDFFCSRKDEVQSGKATEKSEEIAKWCEEEIRKTVEKYRSEHQITKTEPAMKKSNTGWVAKSDIDQEEADEKRFREEEGMELINPLVA